MPSAGEWPRQPTAVRRPPQPTTRPPPLAPRQPTTPEETPSPATDTTNYRTDHYHTAKITEDSTDRAIIHHPETNYTASFFRITTCSETEDQVAEVHKTANTVLSCQDGE